FNHVRDIGRANILSMQSAHADYQIFNVGTGCRTSVLEVAQLLLKELGVEFDPEVRHKYRTGDIRHCVAAIGKISTVLKYSPSVALEEGIADVVSWVREEVAEDRVEIATRQLIESNLLR